MTYPAYPVPTPYQIADKASSVYESTFTGIDARSANSVAATTARLTGLTAYDLYVYQGYIAQQVFANTATDALSIHASIWNVPQLLPTAGTGAGNVTGNAAGVINIPSGTLATAPGGALYMTSAAATIPAGGGTVSVPVVSVLSGTAYNLAGGTVLNLVSPIAGLTTQTITLNSSGIANGTNIESIASWQARIVARIQTPPGAGTTQDYIDWATAAGAGYVNVVTPWAQANGVGIIIAAPGPAVASSQLVAAVQAYINAMAPVTAAPFVVAATLEPVNFAYTLNPDTTETEAAGEVALQTFFSQSAQIGATVFMSRADNAVMQGAGVFSLERSAPTADVTMSNTQLPVLGTVTW